MSRANPHRTFYIWAVVIGLISGLGAFALLRLNTLSALLLALNVSAFLLFGWDKRAARSNTLRVPESVILTLALLGGSPAILLGMLLLRHKTRDRTFLPKFTLIAGLQIAILYWLRNSL